MSAATGPDPIEVEAERLDPRPEDGEQAGKRPGWGPIAVELVLDLADLLTFGPGMKKIALPVGFVVGFFAGARMGLPLKQRLMLGAVGAAYCSLSATSPFPIGTLVGTLYRAGVFGERA